MKLFGHTFIIFTLVLILGHKSTAQSVQSISSDSVEENIIRKIVCDFDSLSYYKGHFTPDLIDPFLCTHINYDFAILNQNTYQIDYGDQNVDIQQNYYEKVTSLKNNNTDLKVLLSIGGWNDSASSKYSALAADENKRSNFISTVIPFLKDHNFDGLDVAWEYPNCWQGNCGVNPNDTENFVTLLTELSDAFANENLLLTASVSGIAEQIDAAYDVAAITNLVEHLNVMTYDFHGSWEKKTGHHAQFYQNPRDFNPSLNFDSAVNHWLNLGANSSKLVLGIPSYGRTFTLADKRINGFNAPAVGPGKPGLETKEGGILGFFEICQDDSWTLFPNDLIGSYSVKGDQWVSYDTPKMAVLKARYIRDTGLGGAAYRFFYTDDYQGKCFGMSFPILRSIRYGLGDDDEKDFETSEDDTKTFLGKMQLAILIDENRSVVSKEENKYDDVSDSDINLKLTETVRTDSGQEEVKELRVNAGTLNFSFAAQTIP